MSRTFPYRPAFCTSRRSGCHRRAYGLASVESVADDGVVGGVGDAVSVAVGVGVVVEVRLSVCVGVGLTDRMGLGAAEKAGLGKAGAVGPGKAVGPVNPVGFGAGGLAAGGFWLGVSDTTW